MSSVISGVWRQAQNTKLPAISHLLSVRVPITANTNTTYNIPANTSNVVQNTAAQQPLNFAPQQNPVLPNNKPQQGLRFFTTEMIVRDANAALTGAGATTPSSVTLVDVTQGSAQVAGVSPSAGINSVYLRGAIVGGAVIINPYDQLAIVFTAQAGGTPSTATAFTVDILGYWQQSV